MTNRNYNTISPSAKSLLFMRGHTTIPFARQTAEIISYPNEFKPDFTKKDTSFWARVLHFENRYMSVNQLMDGLNITNILELSSGYSFRGLDKTINSKCIYVDTDLPELIETKKEIASTLLKNKSCTGSLQILPLNALDESQFRQVLSHFPDGEILIVNEGLLMYLSIPEKEKLCRFIHSILSERGGYWITADIYLKNKEKKLNLKVDKETQDFFERHQIEDNKFENFNEAKDFFGKLGFELVNKASIEHSQLSSMKYFRRSLKFKDIFKFVKAGKIQETWLLKVSK